MADYRRYYVPGGTYFFTVVTAGRQPILTTDLGRKCLHEAIVKIKNSIPFELFAIVLLPDHFHTVWILPEGDDRYPTRLRRIKTEFTARYLAAGGKEAPKSQSRVKKKERGVWQRRFWEHTVRDEDDLKHCVDYIHWNPCKHELAERVCDWEWSSFHRFVEQGEYEIEWGKIDPCPDYNTPEWDD